MILINPMKDTRHEATDSARWHINYIFATYLEKYIRIKGGNVMLSRKSEEAPMMELKALRTNYSPAVTLTIDCYIDLDPSASGYDILCDGYNALVGTINYESYMRGRTPVRAKGYTETYSRKYGKYTDITLYLGFLSNSEDLAYLSDDSNLDVWAKRIIEGAYGPPVKTISDTDPTGNNDPYFYRIDTWREADNEPGSTAEIKETLYSGMPVRYLAVDSHVTGFYPLPEPEEGVEPDPDLVPIPRHYTWSTPVTYDKPTTCLFLGSVRATGGTATAYLRLGNTEHVTEISDQNFEILIFEAEVLPGDSIYVGAQGPGRLDYSGIWIAPKGSLGTLDDPRNTYSIFPPGYRAITPVSDAYNKADAIHIALTNARTLIERAQDTKGATSPNIPDVPVVIPDKEESSNPLDKVLSFASSVTGYAAALSGVMNIIENATGSKLNIIDPATINIDYAALEQAMTTIRNSGSLTAVQRSVNDIKVMADAVQQQMATRADIEAKATQVSEKTKQKIEAKGVALGNS
ncbi:MAG: hypothetical protein IKL53_06805 [Lachnospiraceae bacterium]|nr:hypothetical protein [Lachnospiraceae bacterium]